MSLLPNSAFQTDVVLADARTTPLNASAVGRTAGIMRSPSGGVASLRLDDVMNIVHTYVMTKRLQTIGNSAGIIVDKPILELLGITSETDLELTTDGRSLIITPRLSGEARSKKLAKVQQRTLRNHENTFRKLAK